MVDKSFLLVLVPGFAGYLRSIHAANICMVVRKLWSGKANRVHGICSEILMTLDGVRVVLILILIQDVFLPCV